MSAVSFRVESSDIYLSVYKIIASLLVKTDYRIAKNWLAILKTALSSIKIDQILFEIFTMAYQEFFGILDADMYDLILKRLVAYKQWSYKMSYHGAGTTVLILNLRIWNLLYMQIIVLLGVWIFKKKKDFSLFCFMASEKLTLTIISLYPLYWLAYFV